ncbi:HPr family phosphocarrier protein [soil metagenome]
MSSTCDIERAVIIVNKYGLHARPAAEFVKLAAGFTAIIMVRKDDLEVNGKSIMGMMMLAAERGSEIVIRATGEDASDAVNALVGLVTRRFDEE